MAIDVAQAKAKINALRNNEEFFAEPFLFAAKSAMADFSRRVFVRGEDVNGNTFEYSDAKTGYYDKLYAGTKKGKVRKNGTQKTGNKTTYYENYKAFRKALGRETEHVNFRLTNRLQSDILNAPINDAGQVQIDLFDPFTKEEGFLTYAVRVTKEHKDIIDGLEKKYNSKIFTLNNDEKDKVRKIFAKEVLEKLFK